MKLKPESLRKQLPGNSFQYRELGFDNPIGLITKNLQLRNFQEEEDCEYEYSPVLECFDPYFVALEEIYSTFSIEELDALTEFYENFDVLDFEAHGEALAEIVGEGRFCTDSFIASLPIAFTCLLPSCINCEKNGEYYRELSKNATEGLNIIYGCAFEFTLCGGETEEGVNEESTETIFYLIAVLSFFVLTLVILLVIAHLKRSLKTESFVEIEVKLKQEL
eukprot:snap_masked-scaffold_21-processed-gene-5.73-mRNA-1 protein AED:1.00 eAED:1.00 QI:0/-1/0/0/-1/1/1/0/220